MHIILEGPTAVGKSTLYEALQKEIVNRGYNEAILIHKDRPKEHTRRWVLRDYVLSQENYEPDVDVILADRWHWGEVTYSPIYRPLTNKDGYGLLGEGGWRWVELFLASRGAFIVNLEADNESLARRLKERGDDHVQNIDELFQVSSFYKRARRDSINVMASLDTSGETIDEESYPLFVNGVLEQARDQALLAQRVVSVCPEYVGHLKPDALLVGDKRNITKVYGEETRLTFMPVDRNSSEFLLTSLSDMFWRQVGLININDITSESFHQLHAALGQPTIVPLGGEATRGLASAGVDTTKLPGPAIPHPAYVRRFHTGRHKEYGRLIQDIANARTTMAGTWRL